MRNVVQALVDVQRQTVRQYRFRIELWDVLSTGAPTLGEIVSKTASFSYQLDVTGYVRGGVQLDEPGDRRASRLTCTLVDAAGLFHPVTGENAVWVQENQVVRLWEGDAHVDESQWVCTFTGHLRGQQGLTIDRSAVTLETTLVAYSRRAVPKYLKQTFVSQTYGRSVDYGTILQDVALTEMGLTAAELTRTPAVLGKVTQFTANSIVDISPLEALEKILETVGLVPDFDGEGILRAYSRDLRRSPDKIYEDLAQVISIGIPATETETYNQVRVVGLDATVQEQLQPEQALARATVPVGFWRPFHRVTVQWSNDRTLRARNTHLVVQTSVNDSILVAIGSETYNEADEFGGQIVVEIGTYVAGLLVLIGITLAVQAFVPDLVTVFGFGGSAGETIPVGRLLEAAAIQEIMFALTIQSSGVYEVRGQPVLPIYQELAAEMTIEGTPDWAVNAMEIKNDWLNDLPALQAIALLELLFETAQGKPRELVLVNDLTLEIGDIVQVPAQNNMRVWIESLTKTIGRGEMPVLRASGYLVPETAL